MSPLNALISPDIFVLERAISDAEVIHDSALTSPDTGTLLIFRYVNGFPVNTLISQFTVPAGVVSPK